MRPLSKKEVLGLHRTVCRLLDPDFLEDVPKKILKALPFKSQEEIDDAARFLLNPADGEVARIQSRFATGPSHVYLRHWYPEAKADSANQLDTLLIGASTTPVTATNAEFEARERARERENARDNVRENGSGVIRTPRHRAASLVPYTPRSAFPSRLQEGFYNPYAAVFVGWSKPQLQHLDRTAPGGLSANDGIFNDLRVAVIAVPSVNGQINFRATSLNLAALRSKEIGTNSNPQPVSARARLTTAASAPTTFEKVVPCPRYGNLDIQQVRHRVGVDSQQWAHHRYTQDWMVTPGNWDE